MSKKVSFVQQVLINVKKKQKKNKEHALISHSTIQFTQHHMVLTHLKISSTAVKSLAT